MTKIPRPTIKLVPDDVPIGLKIIYFGSLVGFCVVIPIILIIDRIAQ